MPAREVDRIVGANIRRRRVLLGLSQQALGKRIGLAFQQIQKYENAQNRVGASRLADIAAALDTHPGALFAGAVPDAPFAGCHDAADTATVPDPERATGGDDRSGDRLTLEIARAFTAVPDRCVRESLVTLVRRCAESDPATGDNHDGSPAHGA